MQKQNTVLDIVAVGILVSLLHRGAIHNSWYWSYWWMDILMHVLGGLLVGLVVLWTIDRFVSKKYSRKVKLLILLIAVFLVGVGWEVFEYVSGFFVIEEPFPDTLYDIISDLIGGIAAYFYLVCRK